MEGRESEEESLGRAQLFETLAHPTRIRILRSLQSNPMSFAELKKALAIESSGNLQHHLGKLGDLVKQTEDGKYAITDDAKEALRLLDAMRQAREETPVVAMPEESMKTRLSLFSLLAISMVLLFLVFYEYSLSAESVPCRLVTLDRSSLVLLPNLSPANGTTFPITISIEDSDLFALTAGQGPTHFKSVPTPLCCSSDTTNDSTRVPGRASGESGDEPLLDDLSHVSGPWRVFG